MSMLSGLSAQGIPTLLKLSSAVSAQYKSAPPEMRGAFFVFIRSWAERALIKAEGKIKI